MTLELIDENGEFRFLGYNNDNSLVLVKQNSIKIIKLKGFWIK